MGKDMFSAVHPNGKFVFGIDIAEKSSKNSRVNFEIPKMEKYIFKTS